MNRSKIKLEILKHLDEHTKATVFASISGTFSGQTSNMRLEQLSELNCTEMCNTWFDKNAEKYSPKTIPFEDILCQLEKLKADKIERVKKNKQ